MSDGMSRDDLARYQDESLIRDIVRSARTIAIVGLSPNALRASNFVGYYLQRHGYRVVPVNPKEQTILGETSYPSLAAIPFPVDVVDVFRAPDAVPAIAAQGGLRVIMDRCLKVEHGRHLGQMRVLGFNTGVITSRRGE